MIAALNLLSFAALAFGCVACLFLACWLFVAAISRDIDHTFTLPKTDEEKRAEREGGAQ